MNAQTGGRTTPSDDPDCRIEVEVTHMFRAVMTEDRAKAFSVSQRQLQVTSKTATALCCTLSSMRSLKQHSTLQRHVRLSAQVYEPDPKIIISSGLFYLCSPKGYYYTSTYSAHIIARPSIIEHQNKTLFSNLRLRTILIL